MILGQLTQRKRTPAGVFCECRGNKIEQKEENKIQNTQQAHNYRQNIQCLVLEF